jgi:hypothetical protein
VKKAGVMVSRKVVTMAKMMAYKLVEEMDN